MPEKDEFHPNGVIEELMRKGASPEVIKEAILALGHDAGSFGSTVIDGLASSETQQSTQS
jgi:hypothetical protein